MVGWRGRRLRLPFAGSADVISWSLGSVLSEEGVGAAIACS
jgi:hypothetical protein